MMSLGQAAAGIGAERRGAEAVFGGVSTDSRAIMAGELFVALRGERFDGHRYVAAARERGAIAAMVAQDAGVWPQWVGLPLLVVDDTRLGLGRLGAFWRNQFALPLVAVTGSNGKTTVKEMLAMILREAGGADAPVLATQGNLNNDIGVPLMLLKLRRRHRYAVIEMGMNHPGEIDYLSRMASPGIALINNAHAAHLEGLGSVEAVARAKGELFNGLTADGVAVINRDDPFAGLWREMAGERRVLTFGLEQPADIGADIALHSAGSRMRLRTPQGTAAIHLPVPGLHNVRNALAAAAAAHGLGVDNETIARGLAEFTGVAGRLQRKSVLHGAVMIDDTYNANPASMEAAIAVLAAAPGKRILVLGDMGELGVAAADAHRRLGEDAKRSGIDRLLALGELSHGAARAFGAGGQCFEYVEDLLAAVECLLAPDVTVLVKGSRFMKMERVVKSFAVAGEGECC